MRFSIELKFLNVPSRPLETTDLRKKRPPESCPRPPYSLYLCSCKLCSTPQHTPHTGHAAHSTRHAHTPHTSPHTPRPPARAAVHPLTVKLSVSRGTRGVSRGA